MNEEKKVTDLEVIFMINKTIIDILGTVDNYFLENTQGSIIKGLDILKSLSPLSELRNSYTNKKNIER